MPTPLVRPCPSCGQQCRLACHPDDLYLGQCSSCHLQIELVVNAQDGSASLTATPIREEEYAHRYPVRCPYCAGDLTAEHGVVLGVVIARQTLEVPSRLDQEGWLEDVDDLIANGYHSFTSCNHCHEGLDQDEIM